MPHKQPSVEELQEALDLVTRYGSSHRASKKCDIPATTIRDRAYKAENAGLTSKEKPLDDFDDEIPEGLRLTGLTTCRTLPDGRRQWIRTAEDSPHFDEKAKALCDGFLHKIPKKSPQKAISKDFCDKLINVIPWGDPHCGMYSWADETGNDFDTDIFEADLCGATEHLIKEAPKAKTCLIIDLGDFFHADTPQGTTTRGTRLDMDTRLGKVIKVGVRAFRKCIELALDKHQFVEVIVCSGNHDETLSLSLRILLIHVYEKEPRVKIHDQPTSRHYVRYGKVLIGVTHGHKGAAQNPAKLLQTMSVERPKDWGLTLFRYFYIGHLHHDRLHELPGGMVEQFATLTPADAFAIENAYLSGQRMKIITMHEDYGELKRNTCNINLLRDLATADGKNTKGN